MTSILEAKMKGGFIETAEKLSKQLKYSLVQGVVYQHDPLRGYKESDIKWLMGEGDTQGYIEVCNGVLEKELEKEWVAEVNARYLAPCVAKRGGYKGVRGVISSAKLDSKYGSGFYYHVYDLDTYTTFAVNEKSLKSRIWRIGEKERLDSFLMETSPFNRGDIVIVKSFYTLPYSGRKGRVLGWGETIPNVKTLLHIPVVWEGDTKETWVLAAHLTK